MHAICGGRVNHSVEFLEDKVSTCIIYYKILQLSYLMQSAPYTGSKFSGHACH